jgi:hypothetical protein
MKQLLIFFILVVIVTSCSIERRHYLPGYHIEGRAASDKGLVTNDKGLVTSESHGAAYASEVKLSSEVVDDLVVANSKEFSFIPAPPTCTKESISKSSTNHGPTSHSSLVTSHSPFATGHSSLVIRHSLSPDTLKKPFKPQQQYREVDPVGKASAIVVLAGVALQKIVGLLTWYEVVVPLMVGPGIFIPALIVAIIGVGLSAYSAYRVRKYPEKYKKNEWSKAALAILGWQILMSALFAWLLV